MNEEGVPRSIHAVPGGSSSSGGASSRGAGPASSKPKCGGSGGDDGVGSASGPEEPPVAPSGAESSPLLRPLHHHPSNSANANPGKPLKNDAGSGSNMPGSPIALKSLPSPLRRTVRSYPSAAAILEGAGGAPGAAGADIFSRGRDALLLQQQRQQRRQQQQQQLPPQPPSQEEAKSGSLPPSGPVAGSGSSSSSPLVVTMPHPSASGPSPVLTTTLTSPGVGSGGAGQLQLALGPRLSRHAPLPSFSPRKPPVSPADASVLPLPVLSPLRALLPVAGCAGGGSPRSAIPPSGRPPSPLLRGKSMPSSTPSRSSSSPAPALTRTRSGGAESRTAPPPAPALAAESPLREARGSGGRRSGGSGGGKRLKKKVGFELQRPQPPQEQELQPQSRRRSNSIASSEEEEEARASLSLRSGRGRGGGGGRSSDVGGAATDQRFARQGQGPGPGPGKDSACDLSRLPEGKRQRLLSLLRRLGSDLDEAAARAPAASAAAVPDEVAALHRRIHAAGSANVAVTVAVASDEDKQKAGSSGSPSPLLLGSTALRAQVLRDFGVKPTRAEAAALARFLLRIGPGRGQTWTKTVVAKGEGGPQQQQPPPEEADAEPVLDYFCVRRLLLLDLGPASAGASDTKGEGCKAEEKEEDDNDEEHKGTGGRKDAWTPQLRRRSILQEEAAKSELAFMPKDEASKALLEKMGEAASWLDRHSCHPRFRLCGDAGAAGPAKVCVEELRALVAGDLGLQLEPSDLRLVLRWFGGGGSDGGGGAGLEPSPTGAESAPEAVEDNDGLLASLIDLDLFLQHFWALGAAAKTRRRKEAAQQRFLRVLASVGVRTAEGAGF